MTNITVPQSTSLSQFTDFDCDTTPYAQRNDFSNRNQTFKNILLWAKQRKL